MNLLYNHNLIAYKKVKEELKTKNKTCIVHTTGSGKSFIALQLMIDFLEENPNKHICYVTPLNGIKNQILNHIEKSNIAENTKKF